MSYAQGTRVGAGRSRAEIDELLRKKGATRTGIGSEPGRAIVYFELADRKISMSVPLPSLDDVLKASKNRRLAPSAAQAKLTQLENERWRALVLALKAKFVAIEAGVETLEQAFLAHVVVPGGTVGELVLPAVSEAYTTGRPFRSGFLLGPGDDR